MNPAIMQEAYELACKCAGEQVNELDFPAEFDEAAAPPAIT